ncbi:glycosyltransferase family 4 protein [Flavivirga rizhaonensis]|uniref:Glycosyltransferase n=1 Tax=Flavivirga rizhaonensis TaxID=2559571 RepID=A0A4S1E249_9FLAO|nr:glycosyltransferase family 4 protein [Flavivirga rizhaonensis]TGV04423.1 glycosyltransferase [Flavivirga rizhaonensis]
MDLKKKILIVGPISDFGGREIEVKNIIDALINYFKVSLLSTIPMTKKSAAILDEKHHHWSSVEKKIFNSNLFIKITSIACKFIYRRKAPAYRFIGNKLNYKFFSFNQKYFDVLKKETDKHDIVIFSGELTTKWLIEIITFCKDLNKPLIIRTTGTITNIPELTSSLLKYVETILVHSNSNYQKILKVVQDNIVIIDQTTLFEKELVRIETKKTTDHLTYGYLGRFSKEKGIVEVLKVFKNLNKKLIIAGNGPLLDEVKEATENNTSIEYIGELSGQEIVAFFKLIDILIIPSLEESGPLVGIEAMVAGKIILSTRVGAMMDRLEKTDNQFWFDIKNENSLVTEIKRIESIDTESLENIRHKTRKVYNLRYSRDIIAEKYLEVINNTQEKNS